MIKDLIKKLKNETIFEVIAVKINKIKTITAETPLKKKSTGLEREFKKIFEKIRLNCLTKIKNLFKSQSILHFTFDYLFFYLIK